jgi:hypothetical protein
MISKTIIEAIEIFAVSFAVVLLAVQALPKEKQSNIVRLKHRADSMQKSYRRVHKAS